MNRWDSERRSYTVRLELEDRPGELLHALEPIADNGGNLRSISHERDNVTPRGRIPVEVTLTASPDQFEEITAGLETREIPVTEAGEQRYTERTTVVLVGHLVETDLSDTLETIQSATGGSVQDLSLDAPDGTAGKSSARLELALCPGETDDVLQTVRDVADSKDLRVIESLASGETA